MSSSERLKLNCPASISAASLSRPRAISSLSFWLMMPFAASIAAWALDARMSWRQRRLSKSMEAFISSMIAAGDARKRPPPLVLVTRGEPPVQKRGGEESSRLAGLNKGAMAAFLPRPKPLDLGELSFADGEGVTKSLSDWRGKVVLLNIWATWCVPCRDEMPMLDRLEAELGGKDFQVMA